MSKDQRSAWFEQFLDNDLSMYNTKVDVVSADVVIVTFTKRPSHDLEDK